MKKTTMKVLGVSLGIAVFALCVVMMTKTQPVTALPSPGDSSTPQINQATACAVTPPLRGLVKEHPYQPGYGFHEAEPVRYPKLQHIMENEGHGPVMDGALQKSILPGVGVTAGLNLLGVGVGFDDYQVGVAPPDTDLSVGDNQVVQWVNLAFAVFNKTTGAVELGPINGNMLWKGVGGPCFANNDGDIIVMYDKIANRWVMAQNVFEEPYQTCIAVSETDDATGSFFGCQYPQSAGFPDYPKWGNWPDAYYQSVNNFGPGGSGFVGARPCAYDRAKLLVGDSSAMQICFQGGVFDDSFLPADLDSSITPASGEQEVYLGSIDNENPNDSTTVYEYLYHVDFANPSDSTFTGFGGTMPITVDAFALGCNQSGGLGDCVPSKGVSTGTEGLGDRLMYRLAYSNFVSAVPPRTAAGADHQSWVVLHNVNTTAGPLGERWYEFRAPEGSTNLAVNQQSTFAPDSTNYRWMGSISQDHMGDMLMGYSISSSTTFPSINYTGRLSTDPLNTMETEAQMFAGTGSQTDTDGRWGDYSNSAIDPSDHCTFWYTQEYYTTTTSFAWSTRLGSFKFPSCN